jgi:hypothetical protein
MQAYKLLRTMVCYADFIVIASSGELIGSSTAILWTMTKACESAWLLLSHSENSWKDGALHYEKRETEA